MDKEELNVILDLAKAEESARNIASIIRAFRQEMKNETLSGMSNEDVDELAVTFGKTLIVRLLMPLESFDESDSAD